jgi:hypothetical protein
MFLPSGLSFNWFIASIVVIIAFYGIRAFLGYRSVARDAEADYIYKTQNGMDNPRLSKEGYIRAYKRFYNPRGSLYIAATLTAMMVLLPVTLTIIQFLLEQLYQLTGRSRVVEPGFLVWQFFIYFLLLMSFAGIAYVGARLYHKRAPGTLNQEMESESETDIEFD